MALQLIEVKWLVDSSELELSKKLLSDLSKEAGLAEDEVQDLNKQYDNTAKSVASITTAQKKQATELKKLTTEAKKLETALDNAADEKEAEKLTKELEKVTKELKEAQAEANKLDKELNDIKAPDLSGGGGFSLGSIGDIAVGGVVADLFQSAIAGAGEYIQELTAAQNATSTLFTGTEEELNKIAAAAKGVADTYNQDLNETLLATNALSKEFGLSGVESVEKINNLLNQGANLSGDFLSQVREYSTFFAQAGESADDFLNIIIATEKAGVFNDKGADAVKEFFLSVQEGSDATKEAFAGIGLDFGAELAKIQSGQGSFQDLLINISGQLGDLDTFSPEVGAAIADIFRGAGQDAGTFVQSLTEITAELEKPIELTPYQELQNVLVDVRTGFNEVAGSIADELLPGFLAVVNTVTDLVSGFFSAIEESDRLQRLFSFLGDVAGFLGQVLQVALQSAIDGITLSFQALGGILELVVEGVDRARATFSGLAAFFSTGFDLVIANLAQQFTGLNQVFQGIFELDTDKISQGLRNISTTNYSDIGERAGESFSSAFDSKLSDIQSPGVDEAATEQEAVKVADQFSAKFQEQLNANPGKVTAVPEFAPNSVQALRVQLQTLQKELNFFIDIDDTESRRTILSQIAAIEEAIENADNVFKVLTVAEIDTDSLSVDAPEIPTIEIPVTPPEIKAEDILPDDEAERLRVRTEQAIEKLQELERTLGNFSSVLTIDDGGLIDKLQELDFGDLSITDIGEVVSSGIATANAAINAFADNRIERKEKEKAALIQLEEETGQSQASAIEEIDQEIQTIERRRFRRNQVAAIAEAGIATALAVTKALPNLVLSGIVAALGLTQIAIIASQPLPFRDGVYSLGDKSEHKINGPGTGTSDSIPAKLSRGESVITAKDTVTFSEHIRSIAEGKKPSWFDFGNTSLLGFDMPENDRKALESILNTHESRTNTFENNTNVFESKVNAFEITRIQPEVIRIQPEYTLRVNETFANTGESNPIDYEVLANTLADKMNATETSAMWKDGHLMKAMYNEIIRGNAAMTQILIDIANAGNK